MPGGPSPDLSTGASKHDAFTSPVPRGVVVEPVPVPPAEPEHELSIRGDGLRAV
eukprot:CAMPEP_0168467274 /NCGR_PEP_ID=MMETSP0228-20121227/57098_1 /TAXON_ID=133427 /ORGANISM="Protoceratium reticulatum, Strain CCCM 535 (=CCMP 1889)" /LENGTH=53 /DNA_ID=CAMNT_0008482979 /DNA_START=33 /DNA_END=191 /DNA_ORIENTATION=-